MPSFPNNCFDWKGVLLVKQGIGKRPALFCKEAEPVFQKARAPMNPIKWCKRNLFVAGTYRPAWFSIRLMIRFRVFLPLVRMAYVRRFLFPRRCQDCGAMMAEQSIWIRGNVRCLGCQVGAPDDPIEAILRIGAIRQGDRNTSHQTD